ncbi:prepilin-type N-terminal cleavage/methylation domain-containing protein [Shewanella baltica]|uniref:Methylation site containing protein n=1 Tax=Shewanella baltica (strain OS195) TaxID=399599 RepID=A9KZD1_SHEB9|nr:prepilin-type N-terminal cleavage/methylation domain-containing protein [Shewanella baltica]ABX47690.1 methylation site containing protein [Shewanella baltica OS195]ADT92716.1 methylation site containing protein [Shewanella baltica OS678]EHC04516.1 methylation site containing protein [Shewanella baltica OS625]MCS6128622.1 prepilin-type N-terminal cleavage/methylation domain-containing protein [Shewanella baltica]MCS6140553.1 prepilin-type N-terminal cleavage/methylation domain-containing pr
MKRQQGFTLIELVVVIIILGILAVTAAPKFINLQGDARASTIQGMKGAIQGANSLIYSKAALLGIEGAATGSVDVLGNTVAGTPATGTADDVPVVFGYMAATEAALEAGMDVAFDTGTSPSVAGSSDWIINVVGNSATIWQRGAPADVAAAGSEPAKSCKIVYTQAASAGALPTITVTDNGC